MQYAKLTVQGPDHGARRAWLPMIDSFIRWRAHRGATFIGELLARGGLFAKRYAMPFRHEDKDLLPLLAELAG